MASFVITSYSDSFTISKDGDVKEYQRGVCGIDLNADNDQILKIGTTLNRDYLYRIDLSTDSLDVDGLTSWLNAVEVQNQLRLFFFSSVGGGGGGLQGAINGLSVDGTDVVLGGPLDRPTLIEGSSNFSLGLLDLAAFDIINNDIVVHGLLPRVIVTTIRHNNICFLGFFIKRQRHKIPSRRI